ncbi:MAG: signal peptide peptidase SppA [Gemmatimonadota bacterium]|nr:signal peptide peptidase SppA [Gemmatimonadota bacterium]
MARKSDWIIGGSLVAGFFIMIAVIGLVFLVSLIRSDNEFAYRSDQRIGVVEVNGIITDSGNVVDRVIQYREDDSVKAIVLRINSPGGVVAPTQEIYAELRKTRDGGKTIIATMGSVAASGGYYIACAADSILANPGTLTGSIGVIFEVPNAEGLFDKIGIDWQVIKSGDHKDIGSPARQLTREERGFMQAVVDDTYNQFVDVVTGNRPLARDEVLEISDGQVFTGNQAISLGLVDRLGTFQDAIDLAGGLAGITGKPDLLKPKKKTIFDLMVENMESVFQGQTSVLLEYRLR